MVLEGEFEDEHGFYPAGTYIKNPPGSTHAPRSSAGCTLFVRLRQLDHRDSERVLVRPTERRWHAGLVHGIEVLALDQFGGEEIFVLQGTFQDEQGDYPSGSWIRSPHMSSHHPFSESGCLIFVKAGHLLGG